MTVFTTVEGILTKGDWSQHSSADTCNIAGCTEPVTDLYLFSSYQAVLLCKEHGHQYDQLWLSKKEKESAFRGSSVSIKNSKPGTIKRNAARCTFCGVTIESRYRHHFVVCSCGRIYVDGGKEYLRRGGDMEYIEELSEYEEKTDDEIG